jgi:hypothetical protein
LVIDDGDILYNLLDLPQRHTTGDGTVVDYKYAFDGRKLQEKVTAGASVTQRDYSGEFLYEGGVLKKILFDGGYVINGESGPVYMFFLKDHWEASGLWCPRLGWSSRGTITSRTEICSQQWQEVFRHHITHETLFLPEMNIPKTMSTVNRL